MEDAAPILLLAVVAVFVATAVIGLALWPLAGVPLVVCLLLGSIVATTDPAAVVAIFRDIGAPARLVRLVEGESLLNDAAAIAIFYVLLEMITSGGDADLLMGAWDLAVDLGGGTLLGIVAARLGVAVIPLLRGRRTAEVTLTLTLPYLVFVSGDHFLGVSGVVAVAVAGLVFGREPVAAVALGLGLSGCGVGTGGVPGGIAGLHPGSIDGAEAARHREPA